MDLRGQLPTRPGAAAYPRREESEAAEVEWVVYHHTGSGPARPSAKAVAAYQTGRDSHLAFPAIAYTLFVEGDGTVALCHDLDVVTWGQGEGSAGVRDGVGLNNWLGIAVAFAGEHPTDAQVESLRAVGDWLDWQFGRRLARVGHRDVSRDAAGRALTVCPGERWPQWRGRVGA